MNNVKDIEAAFDSQEWDQLIEQDLDAGRLDWLADEAMADLGVDRHPCSIRPAPDHITGLAGLEPTAYGLGNRLGHRCCKGSGHLLPSDLPKSGPSRSTRSSQERQQPTLQGGPSGS